jgi:hypothetical protein
VQDLLDLHKAIAGAAPKTKLILKAEYCVALHLTLAARYHLTIGGLARSGATSPTRSEMAAWRSSALRSQLA